MRIYPSRNSGFLLLLSAFILVLSITGKAQESISGTINKYAKVVSVDAADQVTLSSAAEFAIGDTVLIVQMKGIEISVLNDFSFGLKQNFNSAGYYEFIIISNIAGNQITFMSDMTYTYDAGGHVQLVKVRGFDNAKVTGTLTCDPWDPVSGTGGVIAVIIGNTLTLEADIDVSSNGFLGGSSVIRPVVACGTGDYYFNDASTESGYKGEGIASYHAGTTPLGTGYLKGLGRYFNGGGGGNGLYSGGGGGGNGGEGGNGGNEELSRIPCGFSPIGGIKGYDIPGNIDYKNQKRIFMGGGGGAGTQLTGTDGTDGGNGGGIVIIVADTLVGNNYSILSNGETVSTLATGDGSGGGGGAGGTILLEVNSYKGSNLTLEANGGNGGAVSGVPTCTGPGGGGGGGIIWHSKAGAFPGEVSTSVLPGVAIPGACAGQIPQPGSPGVVTDDLIVQLTGFLFNSIYSSRTGFLLDTICEDDVPPMLLGTYPKGGTTPYTFVWESSENKTVWNIVAGGTNQNYTPVAPLIDTTYYRRTVLDNSGPQIVDVSKTLTIIVQPKIQNYDITTHDTICYDTAPILLESDALGPPIGGDGFYTYYWEDSIDGGSWTLIGGAIAVNYQPLALLQTTYYRRTTLSGIGCPKTSNIATITVLDIISNNDITSPDEIICEGTEFAPLNATDFPVLSGGNTAAGDYRFEWEESTDGFAWNAAFGPNTNVGYAPDTLSAKFPNLTSVQFRRIAFSGPTDVCIDTSDVVNMTQWPKITDNVVPYDLEYCENDDPDPIIGTTPGGGDGGSYLFQWQELNGTWGDIVPATSKDYDPEVLTDSLFFRRIVSSDVCRDTSLVDTIPVNPALQNFNIQTISGALDTTICFGQTPNTIVPEPLTILGGDGLYTYFWEDSIPGGSWNLVPGGTFDILDPPPLNVTTIYRRNVISNVCADLSNEVTINVLPLIANNTLSSNNSVCSGLTITITGSDPTGGAGADPYTYLWEESLDDAAWVAAAGTNDQRDYTSPALTVQTYYRRTVFSGLSDCCQDISISELITIDPLPTATLTPIDVTICDGSSETLTFNLTGTSSWNLTYFDGINSKTIPLVSNTDTELVTPPALGAFTNYDYQITTLVDGNGCIADAGDLTGNAKIRVDGIPTISAGLDAGVCGLTYTLQASLDFGAGSWTFPAAVVDAADNTNPNKVVTVDSYGTFNFTWSVINGVCPIDQDDVDITFYEAPSPADAGQDSTLGPLTFDVNLYGNTPLVGTGEWTNVPVDAQASIVDPSDPGTEVNNLDDKTTNKFKWTITNGVCPEESDEVMIDVILFSIPSGFSPNGDAINDFFVISGVTDYPNELIILNRQGTEVFKTINYQNDWEGKYSSGDDVPDDTYYYVLYYTKDGTRFVENGWLLIRR